MGGHSQYQPIRDICDAARKGEAAPSAKAIVKLCETIFSAKWVCPSGRALAWPACLALSSTISSRSGVRALLSLVRMDDSIESVIPGFKKKILLYVKYFVFLSFTYLFP